MLSIKSSKLAIKIAILQHFTILLKQKSHKSHSSIHSTHNTVQHSNNNKKISDIPFHSNSKMQISTLISIIPFSKAIRFNVDLNISIHPHIISVNNVGLRILSVSSFLHRFLCDYWLC